MQHPLFHFACLPQELKACHEEMRVSSSTTPRKKTHKGAEEKSVGWVEVLTDTLLGLLSRPSLLWRGVVNQAFRMVAHHVTSTALGLVLKVSLCTWHLMIGKLTPFTAPFVAW